MVSIAINILLIVKNKELKIQIKHLKLNQHKKQKMNNMAGIIIQKNKTSHLFTTIAKPKENQLSQLEFELDKEITLDDIPDDNLSLNNAPHKDVEFNSEKSCQAQQITHQESFLQVCLRIIIWLA